MSQRGQKNCRLHYPVSAEEITSDADFVPAHGTVPYLPYPNQAAAALQASLLLNLQATHKLSDTGLDAVMESNMRLLDLACQTVSQCEQSLETDGLSYSKLNSSMVYSCLKTKNQTKQFYRLHFKFVEPKRALLGNIRVNMRRGKRFRYVNKSLYGYYVPFLEQLESLLGVIKYNTASRSNSGIDMMMDCFHGKYVKSHPGIFHHKDCLLFVLY